jgi:hypothetical protein
LATENSVIGAPMPSERAARPGEVCSCGQPAVIVYITEKFGDVPYCGIAGVGPDDDPRADT